MRRIAVTGVGLVTPLGLDAETTFAGLAAGRSGISHVEGYDPTGEKVAVAGEVKAPDVEKLAAALPQEARDRSSRFVYFAVAAAREALRQAGNPHQDDPEQSGVITGVGYGKPWPSAGYKVGPTTVIQAMPNAAAAWIAILENLKGPSFACSTACASGSHAIGLAYDQIKLGRAVGMLAGGVDTVITRDVMRSFAWLRALNSARDEEPATMSRPFDLTRRGFVMGEGAGFVYLEDYAHAVARGAPILAEMKGWGSCSDAYHVVAVPQGGEGMARAIRKAVDDAGIPDDAIDYVAAHGTSTPMNDKEETQALRKVFGAHAHKMMISSQKSMLGHSMGAAGGISAAVTVMTLAKKIATPTINLRNPDPDCDLNYVPNEAKHQPMRAAISNSFGFGGHNSTLVFAHPEAF